MALSFLTLLLDGGEWSASRTGHFTPWNTGLRDAKGLIQGPSARRTKDLLELNRDQLRWMIGLLTGHLSPKRAPFQIGID
jgi:hypothetical protein